MRFLRRVLRQKLCFHMVAVMSDPVQTLFSQASVLQLAPQQTLFHAGDAPDSLFMVRKGVIALLRNTTQGHTLVLQRAQAGQIVAEASVYSQKYHCDAVATEACELASLPKLDFLTALDLNPGLARVWASRLAREVQIARTRAEIRTLPRVKDRLDAWLLDGNMLPEKGAWQQVAAELGVSREALYRELSRRRSDK